MSPPSLSEQLQRGQVFAADCPSRAVLDHVTSRWGVLALVALRAGTLRFSDLRRRIGGVSEKMLAQTLQTLEADGLVLRRAYPVVPPHVEYSLTALGGEAAGHVEALVDWIEASLPRVLQARAGRQPAQAPEPTPLP
ncbi:helix-turn-helix transcriptional regulator [Stenotrophomonas sp. MMGLT7]|nr:helix-turn-helix transcriptional regulator [Stenotrophomonas sp. MMGLT7]